jgi:hypothetical protein
VEKFINTVSENEDLQAKVSVNQDTPDFIYSFGVSFLSDQPWVWQGQNLDFFLKQWKVSEETFDMVYSVCSKILRTIKIGIKNVQAVCKKLNAMREKVVYTGPIVSQKPLETIIEEEVKVCPFSAKEVKVKDKKNKPMKTVRKESFSNPLSIVNLQSAFTV